MGLIDIDFEKAIKSLSPVTWVYNNDPKKKRQIGYIAEEVNEIDSLKYIVMFDSEDKPLALRYDLISVYTVEVLKNLLNKIEQLENEIKALKHR